MADLSYLIAPAITFAIAAGSPGPATLALAATAMARGRRAGLMIGLGLGLGLAFWGMIAAAGLGAILLAWAPAFLALRLAGGIFLLWLACKAAGAALSAQPPAQPMSGGGRYFLRGLLLNLLNPKAVLAWGAAIVIGLPQQAATWELALVTATCAALGWLIYGLYAVIFSTGRAIGVYARTRRWIDAACAAAFGLAGLRLLTLKTSPY